MKSIETKEDDMQTTTAKLKKTKDGGYVVRVHAIEVYDGNGDAYQTIDGACAAARRVFGENLVINYR